MNELELLARLLPGLTSNSSVITGAGDDCAVVQMPASDSVLLLKTDAVVEGVHFTDTARAEQIGHKALARCLSDIAAMAGQPLHALITLGLPREFQPERVEGFYSGINRLAARYHMAIVGGETVTNPDRVFISVAVVGMAPKERCILRTGSRPGDAIFVTGRLGGSLAGHHLDFEPRLLEASWLAEHFPIHAMIDLSDGLATDLRHLLHSTAPGADLLGSAIPIHRAARTRARSSSSAKPALLAALTDGEDFELLFTIASDKAVSLLDAWKARFPDTSLSCIGKISAVPGLRLRTREGVQTLAAHGYLHFA